MRAFWKRQGPDAETPVPSTTEEISEEEVRAHATAVVHAGFLGLDDAVEQVTEYFDEEAPPPERVAVIVRDAWTTRAAAVDAGAGTDDHARLAHAFELLATDGIVGRMDFTCCQTCGHAEIGDERASGEERGYTFFHQQDTERIADGELFLAFGSFGPSADLPADLLEQAHADEDSAERRTARAEVMQRSEQLIADAVAGRLRDAGLTVTWDGQTSTRIKVGVPDWRRPLPA